MRALGLAALCFTACGVDATLTTEKESHSPGESVTLKLTNRSLAPLGYNLCGVQLRALGGGRIDDSDGVGVCTLILNRLEGGRWVTSKARPLPGGLPAGRYFYRTSIEGPDAPLTDLESNTFTVTP